MTNHELNFRFSIIIPLEFHRGQVEACLHRWAYEQTYPRDQYEVIAAGCRSSFDEETLASFESNLDTNDRLLLYDQPHDIALNALAARDAREEILIFTESHCLPERNALTLTNQMLHAHPEWSGFSGSTSRVVHNRLSVAEAEMYEADIRFGMEKHPWLKLLDQYFVVWKKKYDDAGGFRSELGHFAEWHLAARMREKVYKIGYAPEIEVQHHYSGDLNELVEFTEDFSRGEMIFHSEFLNDGPSSYFQAPTEWIARYQWHPAIADKIFPLIKYARFKPFWKNLDPYNFFSYCKLLLNMSIRKYCGIQELLLRIRIRRQIARWVLSLALVLSTRRLLSKIFLRFIEAVIQFERVRFVKEWLNENFILTIDKPIKELIWKIDTSCPYPSAGFHASEDLHGKKFRWSEPIAIIVIPVMPGNYDLKIEWLPIRNVKNLTLYVNEKPVPSFHEGNRIRISFQVNSNLPTYFALTCEPLMGRNDERLLGIPITSVSIQPQN